MTKHRFPIGSMRRVATTFIMVCLGTCLNANAQSYELLSTGTELKSIIGVSEDGNIVRGLTDGSDGLFGPTYKWTSDNTLNFFEFDPARGSVPFGMSSDGSTLVGRAFSSNGIDQDAFRWNEIDGLVAIGGLPETRWSIASDASEDGSVLVGTSTRWVTRQLFRWTSTGGFVSPGLPAGYNNVGTNPKVSSDGEVIVGSLADSTSPGQSQAFRWTQSDGVIGLGFLPGLDVSGALAVSPDGGHIVGTSSNGFTTSGFVWTETGGMIPLDMHPISVSENGAVIVGTASASTVEGRVWTEETGIRTIAAFLRDDYGLDFGGWTPDRALLVSANGNVIVGTAKDAGGNSRFFRAALRGGPNILEPVEDELIVVGEPTTLRWSRPDASTLMTAYLLPDTLGSDPILLDFGIDADTFEWTPTDETLFSRSARIRIYTTQDPTVADTSDFFRIKPYHLTRLSTDETQYVPFKPQQHGWSFGNEESYLFPDAWWQQAQFDYVTGDDPFTQVSYDSDLWKPPIFGQSKVYPDWPATVRAYGTDAAYWLIVEGVSAIYKGSFEEHWGGMHDGNGFRGSCYGLAVSSLLAFMFPEPFRALHPNIGSLSQSYTPATFPDNIREVINTYFTYQYSAANIQNNRARHEQSPMTTLANIKKMLLDGTADDASTLTLAGVKTCSPFAASGGHAVVPYRVADDPDNSNLKRIYVDDSNHPGDITMFVEVDVSNNRWSYADQGWGGSCGMWLNVPISNDLGQPSPPSPSLSIEKSSGGPGAIVVHAIGDSAAIAAVDGAGSIGFAGDAMFNTLEGAVPMIPLVGGPALPVAYQLPDGSYDVSLSGTPEGAVSAVFVGDEITYSYSRTDTDVGNSDIVSFSPGDGLHLRSDEASATKQIAVRAIISDATSERTIEATDVQLSGADSVRFAAIGEFGQERMQVANAGGAKSYNVRLREASSAGEQVFEHVAIAILPGATHTVRAAWDSLRTGRVTLDIDEDSDGTTDSSIELVNQVSIEIDDVAGTPLVEAATLLASYPNPFSVQTTIPFVLTEPTDVQITVHDVLGREVARIADGHFATGRLEATIDGRDLASGLYIVRMNAGGVVSTQTVVVAR